MLSGYLFHLALLLGSPVLGRNRPLDPGLTSERDLRLQTLEHLGVVNADNAPSWRSKAAASSESDRLDELEAKYGPHTFKQKRSHFDPEVKEEFDQYYSVDASHYKPGGPVIIQDNGESHYLNPFWFQPGALLELLARNTSGIAVVLGHRYYGNSTVTPDLSTDNMRWLTHKEALEDSAEFIRRFPTPAGVNLSAPDALSPQNTPFIYIGSSYPGARAVWMRKQYPDLVWGALGSSAVVRAQADMPEWFGSIEKYGGEACVRTLAAVVAAVDRLLDANATNTAVKSYFGFDPAISNGLFGEYLGDSYQPFWQQRLWDDPEGAGPWDEFCTKLGAQGEGEVDVPGLGKVPAAFAPLKDGVKEHVLSNVKEGQNVSSLNALDDQPPDVGLGNKARPYTFQTCAYMGWHQGAQTDPSKRAVVSKFATMERWLAKCQRMFPPGKAYQLPAEPNTDEHNVYGGFDIAVDRLATIDGEFDPWRAMSVNADGKPKRDDTITRPSRVIPRGGHGWDWDTAQDGNLTSEPEDMQKVHGWELEFVNAWVKQFHDEKKGNKTAH